MSLPFYRHTIAKINLDAITHNIDLFRKRLPKETEVMAIVKADAYGHGVIPVVKHLKTIGIRYFAVGFLDEAIQIRNAGIQDPILVLGFTASNGIDTAFENDITLTIYTKEAANIINEVGKSYKKKLKVHLKVDTGMARLGLFPEDLYQFYLYLQGLEWLEVEGVFTHFATADEKDKTFALKQYELFENAIEKIKLLGDIPLIHASNSAAIIDMPNLPQNMVRLGISLYGLLPSSDVSLTYDELEPVMTLKTEVSYVKVLPADKTVSYGATYRTKKETVVATLPIGYADGLSRKLSNKGYVIIHGKKAPIIGRVCMDQTMIDVTDIENVKIGDEVIIFGSVQDGQLVDEHASIVGTINYELITLIGKRIPRVYYKDGKITEINNSLLL